MEYLLVHGEFTNNLSVFLVEILVVSRDFLKFGNHFGYDWQDRVELREFMFKLNDSENVLEKGFVVVRYFFQSWLLLGWRGSRKSNVGDSGDVLFEILESVCERYNIEFELLLSSSVSVGMCAHFNLFFVSSWFVDLLIVLLICSNWFRPKYPSPF